jgi:hypothetical protein
MKGSTHHRVHALVTFVVAVMTGMLLLPLLRAEPESVHDYARSLNIWLRVGFISLLCIFCAYTVFKLLSPRLIHLHYCWSHPPTWLAWLLDARRIA